MEQYLQDAKRIYRAYFLTWKVRLIGPILKGMVKEKNCNRRLRLQYVKRMEKDQEYNSS